MDCKIVKEMIPLYMDGILTEKEMEDVASHLQHCHECKAIHQDLFKIENELKSIPTVRIPEDFQWKVSGIDETSEISNESRVDIVDKRKNNKLNWKIISTIAAVLVISIALSSEVIEMETILAEEPENMISMARLDTYNEAILWEDVENVYDEEKYYNKLIQDKLGPEIGIEDSYKDAEDTWYFTVISGDIIYKYKGKGGEIWIEE